MPDSSLETITKEVVELLKKLIATPSFSREEDKTADILQQFLENKGVSVNRLLNNVWAQNLHFNKSLPTILLNSHHDTVKPNVSWTYDPFLPVTEEDKLTGLGSNDAGGSLVSLLGVFLFFFDRTDLKYNLVFAASAEEEVSGKNGIELLLPELPPIDFGLVGEPTQMNLAIAEKGLMVLDCVAEGKSGHAARNEGENAIYKALKDIEWFRTFEFPIVSESLGPVKMSVTQINAGTQHNVVPDECRFVVDIRATNAYSLEQTLEIISSNVASKVTPRSVRLKPSGIPLNHPIVKAGLNLGRTTYGSPTLSDQALMNFPTLKIGPGDSARSHTANEFICISEIENGIEIYKKMLEQVIF